MYEQKTPIDMWLSGVALWRKSVQMQLKVSTELMRFSGLYPAARSMKATSLHGETGTTAAPKPRARKSVVKATAAKRKAAENLAAQPKKPVAKSGVSKPAEAKTTVAPAKTASVTPASGKPPAKNTGSVKPAPAAAASVAQVKASQAVAQPLGRNSVDKAAVEADVSVKPQQTTPSVKATAPGAPAASVKASASSAPSAAPRKAAPKPTASATKPARRRSPPRKKTVSLAPAPGDLK